MKILNQDGNRLKSLSLAVGLAHEEDPLCSQYVLAVLLYSPVVCRGQK